MLQFGSAIIDLPRREVRVDGDVRHLEPQAFDLLAYLVEHRDRVIPKHELLDEVWGDQFVSESALTTRVKEIRRALGDDGTRQAFVKNFRARGYRFVAEPDAGTPARTGPEPIGSGIVGRDDDVAAILRTLGRAPVVTLVGPGGVGKTTLARAVAERRATTGSVHEVVLTTSHDEAGVLRAFERACDLAQTKSTDDLAAAVSDLRALVVVDNCEHVVGPIARFVAAIVRHGGPVRILATSRERLGVAGEQVVPVAPLDRNAALVLLAERARATRPDLVVDVDDPQVERLLSMLDRLPLAIEMASARLGTIGVAELVEHLGDRLDLLRSADRGADDRHATLVEVIAWSERLLGSEARRVLHDMSVFAGPVTATDLAVVIGGEPSRLALGPLTDLTEHSLVVADTGTETTRYRLLETVRAVTAHGRDSDVDERHARFVADEVDAADRVLRGPGEPVAALRLRSLEAEIAAAHRWARANDHVLAARITTSLLHYAHERQWNEPAAWSRELLERDDLTVDPAPFAAAASGDASNRDDVAQAMRWAESALLGADPRVVAFGHETLGNVGLYTGDLEMTARHAAAELQLADSVGDGVSWSLAVVGAVLADVYGGRIDAARRIFELHRSGPAELSPTSTAWLRYCEGELLAAEGDDPAAIECFRRAIELGESVDSPFVVGVAQVAELSAQARAGDIGRAMAAFRAVLMRYRRTHRTTHAITALRNLIVLLGRAERDADAMRLLGALSRPEIKATYGAESDALAAARDAAVARRGESDVAGWVAEGTVRDTAWALDAAIDLLDGG